MENSLGDTLNIPSTEELVQLSQKAASALHVKRKKRGRKPKGLKTVSKRKSRKRKLRPLTPEQERLVKDHLYIADFAARKALSKTRGYTGCFELEDLVSVARYAICVAAKDFDPKLGFKFSTYSSRKAEGYIQHALRDYSRLVRIPRFVYSYRDNVRELSLKGYTPEEISDTLDISLEKVVDCMHSWKEIHSSIDSPYSYSEDGDSCGLDIPVEGENLESVYLRKFLNEMSKLPDNIIYMLLDYAEGSEKLNDWEREFCQNFFELYRGKLNSKIRI